LLRCSEAGTVRGIVHGKGISVELHLTCLISPDTHTPAWHRVGSHSLSFPWYKFKLLTTWWCRFCSCCHLVMRLTDWNMVLCILVIGSYCCVGTVGSDCPLQPLKLRTWSFLSYQVTKYRIAEECNPRPHGWNCRPSVLVSACLSYPSSGWWCIAGSVQPIMASLSPCSSALNSGQQWTVPASVTSTVVFLLWWHHPTSSPLCDSMLVGIKWINVRRNTAVFSNCWRKQLHVSALFWVGHHQVETGISEKTNILQWGNEISFYNVWGGV
jgi:hypothetical protein